jgi:hypothetical protein
MHPNRPNSFADRAVCAVTRGKEKQLHRESRASLRPFISICHCRVERKRGRIPHMKANRLSLILVSLLTGFAFLQAAQAVVPPPDGGYLGGNTGQGQDALLNLTTGVHNTAVGFLSLKSDTTGGYNTAIGSGTLLANNADGNTAAGTFALLNNTTGGLNTANGALALFSNTNSFVNTAVGFFAL